MLSHFRCYNGLKPNTCLHYQVLSQQKHASHQVLNIAPNTHLEEQETQSLYLTKTVLRHSDKLPDMPHIDVASEDRSRLHFAIKKCIIETNYFHRYKAPVWKHRYTEHRKIKNMEYYKGNQCNQILFNMLRVVWASKAYKDFPRASQTITYRIDLTAPWERLGKKLQVSGRHGHLISGKTLLGLFADPYEISKTKDEVVEWTDIIDPFFDMNRINVPFIPNTGFLRGSPYPCPQTLILQNLNIDWPARFNTGNAIWYSFAHAMTYALSHGEEMGKDLVNPVPIQCMVFNGVSFYFLCYQLNTLNFSDDNYTTKNMAWLVSNEKLYEHVTDTLTQTLLGREAEEGFQGYTESEAEFLSYRGSRVSLTDFDRERLSENFSDDQTRKVYLKGYNKRPVDMFANFLLNPPT